MAQNQPDGREEKDRNSTALKDLLSRIDLEELMKKDEPPLQFPKTLEEFEYSFNEKGQLRHTKTGEPYVFNYHEDMHRWNQKRYEALGEIITHCVYELLEKECHLKKVYLPVDATEDEPKSFIFMSEDATTNPDKLMILIHGNGVVRVGQWARRLIINEDLDSGTQIPFIKRAMDISLPGTSDYRCLTRTSEPHYLTWTADPRCLPGHPLTGTFDTSPTDPDSTPRGPPPATLLTIYKCSPIVVRLTTWNFYLAASSLYLQHKH